MQHIYLTMKAVTARTMEADLEITSYMCSGIEVRSIHFKWICLRHRVFLPVCRDSI